jgi:hypothetical protein
MRAPFNTLFGRLFGVLLVAIVLAHGLAFSGFTITANRPRRRHRALNSLSNRPMEQGRRRRENSDRPWFGGPVVPLTFQFFSLIIAAWYGAKLLSRPIQRLSEAAERLSLDLDSPHSTNPGLGKRGRRH